MIKKNYVLVLISLSILSLSIVSPALHGSAATNGTFTIGYGNWVYHTSGYTLGSGDTIAWGFTSSNSYVGITVYAMSSSNYALWSNGYTASVYTLSSGLYVSDSGTFNVPYTDTDWYIVYYNQDPDMMSTTLTEAITAHDYTVPTLTITSPVNNAIVSGTITITASANDANGINYVQSKYDSASYIQDSSSPYAWTLNTALLTDGTHTIYVQAFDTFGNWRQVTIYIVVDNTGPTVTITAPANGAKVSGSISVTATATDAHSVSTTKAQVDSNGWITDSSSPYAWTLDTILLTDGPHTVYVQGVDSLGNTASKQISITVDNTPPSLTVSAPINGATVSGSITIAASSSDTNGVSYVEYNIDGGSWISDTISPYTWTFDTTAVSDGSHIINFKSVDSVGNSQTTQMSIIVSNKQVTTSTPPPTTSTPPPTTSTPPPTTSTPPPTTSTPPPTTSSPFVSSSSPSPSTSSPPPTSSSPNIKGGSSPGFELVPVILALGMSFAIVRRKMKKS